MKIGLALLALIALAGCKKQEVAQETMPPPPSQPVAQPAAQESEGAAFERASNQYLIDTQAVKAECASLFSPEMLNVMKKMQPNPEALVCGKMTHSADTTRQLIDIKHGGNQASPWDGKDFVTAGIFAIADNVVMTVMLYPEEQALVLVGE